MIFVVLCTLSPMIIAIAHMCVVSVLYQKKQKGKANVTNKN